MDKIIEHENLKEEIEKKRRQLYKLLELELNGDIIVNFSQELDLLINRYNEINRQGRQGDRSSDWCIFRQMSCPLVELFTLKSHPLSS